MFKGSKIAIDRYLANPNICKECNQQIPIHPKYGPAWTRSREFCNYTCSATFNAKHRLKLHGVKPLADRTMGEVIGEAKTDSKIWWRARIHIGNHARRAFGKSGLPKACRVCGYDKHVEIAHKKAVMEFPDTALISEINAITNLGPLCRNHHWEQEHNVLTPEDLAKFLSS